MKLLLVEDEREMVELLRRFLEPIASQIVATDNLTSALLLSAENRFDVIVQDLKLINTGVEEGLAAIKKFKQHSAAVVVVSGRPDPDLRQKVLSAGADAFVPKDKNFNTRAMLMAVNIATKEIPGKSESFKTSAALLRKICEELSE